MGTLTHDRAGAMRVKTPRAVEVVGGRQTVEPCIEPVPTPRLEHKCNMQAMHLGASRT